MFFLFTTTLLFAQNFSLDSKSNFLFEKDGKNIFTTISNSRYLRFSKFVVHEIITTRNQEGADGSFGRLEATAFNVYDNISDREIWKITDYAHNAYFQYGFYVAEEEGCCGGESTAAFFNLENGRKIFSSSSKILKFDFLKKNPFFISFLSVSSTKDFPPQYPYRSNFKILITLSSEKRVISRLILKIKSNEFADYDHTPDEIYFSSSKSPTYLSLEKTYKNKKSLSDISFEFDYWGPKIKVLLNEGIFSITSIDTLKDVEFIIITGNEKDSYLFNENFQNIRGHTSNEKLRLLRNEIFARNNHSFKSKDLVKLFKNKPWYVEKKDHKVSADELTINERTVLEIISGYEKSIN